jgi:hypothetical protein
MTEHKKAPRPRAATLVMTKRFEVGSGELEFGSWSRQRYDR